MRYSKFIVLFVIISNIGYTAACLYVFLKTGLEPVTLTVSWFAFTTGELLALAGIRIKKTSKGDESNENQLDS